MLLTVNKMPNSAYENECKEDNRTVLTLAEVGDWVVQIAVITAAQWTIFLHVAHLVLATPVGEAGVHARTHSLKVHLAHLAIITLIVVVTVILAVCG